MVLIINTLTENVQFAASDVQNIFKAALINYMNQFIKIKLQ